MAVGKKFAIENLPEVDDGKIKLAVNRAIQQAYDDMVQRPGDRSKRKVSLDIEFTPMADDDGLLHSVSTEFAIGVKVPERRSKPYPMEPHAGSKSLLFNPASPEDPHQHTIDEATGEVK